MTKQKILRDVFCFCFIASLRKTTKWVCQYHIVFLRSYGRKIIYQQLCEDIRKIRKDWCKWKGIRTIEGHTMPNPIHLLQEIPPQMRALWFMGYLKGKKCNDDMPSIYQLKYKFGNRNF